MINENNDIISEALLNTGAQNEKNKLDEYLEMKNEKEICGINVTESLFKNLRLGEKRAKLENEIKLLQAEIIATKSTEDYLELYSEKMRKRISQISSDMRRLEEEPEIKEYLKKEREKGKK